ncbi:DNA internalization-related competence protein ComEC/Rec2 [Desulfovibrio sp. X2]|uniref:DNA internalization-related competence protein ComEC/Rec2 n=1 Tax=Desulfovibrio sp. X2 TaxID=941449 RepID=UPI000358C13C|nr:DNA internalization-related competence protein ComEC/Rec2 [Desulfovibrio sp. X2]EPR37019.1 DNA internalization-related competence protein ComEC/Rec2 [Desulfovibrio sp. X2]
MAGEGTAPPRGARGLFSWQILLLAYAAGILALRAPVPAGVGLLVLVLFLGLYDAPRFRPVLLLLLAAAFGLGLGLASRRLPAPPAHIPQWILERDRVVLSGRVADVESRPEESWRAVLDGVSCRLPDGREETLPGRLVLTWVKPETPPRPGERVTAQTRVYPEGGLVNFGGYDFSFSWIARGVFWRAWAMAGQARAEPGGGISGAGSSLGETLAAARARVVERLAALAPPDQPGALVRAVLAGDRSGLERATVERMRAAALSHTLALSGLHLAMAAGLGLILAWLLGRARPSLFLRIPLPRLSVLLGAPLVLLYLWLGGAGYSLLRAACMFAAWGAALWRGRAGAFLDGLFLALAAILLVSPLSLYDLGLQMSALAVAGIIVLAPAFDSLARRAAERLIPAPRLRPVLRWPLSLLGVSLAANLALLPLSLRVFGEVPAGLLWNLLWLPLMQFWLMPAALLSLLPLGLGLPGPAAFLLHCASLPASLLLDLLARAEGAGLLRTLTGVRPLWPAMLGYWLLWVWWLARRNRNGGRKDLVLAGLAFCLLAGPVAANAWEDARPRVAVEVLDVGQGQAVLVTAPGGRRVLVDAGGLSASGFDMGRAVVVPRLTLGRDPVLTALLLSHTHTDHAGGVPAVLGALRVDSFVWSGLEQGTKTGERLLTDCAAAGVPVHAMKTGETLDLGHGVALTALHPEPDFTAEGLNDLSLVLRLTWNGRGLALIPGDAEQPAIADMLRAAEVQKDSPLAADLLVLPHHGASGSVNPRFYRAVAPRLAVASAGWLNRWNFPGCRTRAAMRDLGLPLYATAADGAVRVSWDAPDAGPVVATALGAPLPLGPCPEARQARISKAKPAASETEADTEASAP